MAPDAAVPAHTIQIVAHRGASGDAPETTLEAYSRAINLGADFLEMDVRRLKDGTIVAMHDATLKRTTNGRGRLANLALDQLKTLDAGSWFNRAFPEKADPAFTGLRVPTLQEIVDLAIAGPTGLYVELKDPERYQPGFESSVLSIIHQNEFAARTVLFSFSRRSIQRVKALDPSIRTALLVSRRGDAIKAAIKASANELSLRHDLLTPRIVAAARSEGLSISVWTVDTHHDMQRMIDMQVDRIITDYPGRLRKLLDARAAAAPPS